MTTPAVMITNARRFAHVNTSQYSDTDAYKDINHIKDEIWNRVVTKGVSSYFNWEEWTTETIALQGEYKLEIPTSSVAGTKTINSVSVNYDGETYTNTGELKYIKCKEVDPKSLAHEWGYYQENQSKESPIYFQKDNSVFIAPTPLASDAGVGRLKVEGIRKIADWSSGTSETETKFPVEYHYVFELGLIVYALMSKGADDNTINNARNTYINASRDVVNQMTSRSEQTTTLSYPLQQDETNIIFNLA